MTKEGEHQNQFSEFNSENLAVAIQNAFPFLSQDKDRLKEELEKYVFPRLSFMAKDDKGTRFFLFENRYVETEWKDMIGIHYINTSYEMESTVMRVHLFMHGKMQENDYVGCFTLRTINEIQIMLSYIYPNWKYITYDDNVINVMTYRKKVHINGYELVFHTYPLFVQDNAAIACAEACLVSMSKYLHSRYDYSKIHVKNINGSHHTHKNKVYPSQGLRPTQMLEVLYSHNIQCEYEVYYGQWEFKEYIDYCIESAMPVLVGLHVESDDGDGTQEEHKNAEEIVPKSHMIQIIGHTDVEVGKEYIVYDDSGCYLKSLKKDGFVGCVSWEKLRESLKVGKDFIIYPIHEKVYFLYDTFKKHINDVLKNMGEGVKEGSPDRAERTMLIDNRDVKKFLRQKILDNPSASEKIREEAHKLISMNMPHYLWCYERETSEGYMLFFADPTYNRRTTRNIFMNKDPLMSESQIGLLGYSELL